MLDKATLSKHKYVYIARCDGNAVHVERFPIVYINSRYAYYAVGNHEELRRVLTSNIKECMEDWLNAVADKGFAPYLNSGAFLKVMHDKNANVNDFMAELKARAEKRNDDLKLKAARRKVLEAEENLEKAKQNLAFLEVRASASQSESVV